MQMIVHTTGKGPVKAEITDGQTVLAALQKASISLYAPCGGKGTCGRCKVLIKDSQGINHKLACQTRPQEDIEIFFENTGSIHVEGTQEERKKECLEELVGPFGVAIDIGTTTMVFHLIDRGKPCIVATTGCVNPQVVYGGDVLSRIQAAGTPEGLDALCSLLGNSVVEGCDALCAEIGITRDELEQVYIAGNTVMEHFAAGLDPTSIGVSPFTPRSLFGDIQKVAASEGELEAFFAPAVASYVGGDITAGLSITDIKEVDDLQLFIDIGTNGEMALGHKDRLISCACAAGPAFEGACITLGMPALPGAVNKVSIDDSGFKVETIDGQTPLGICGSGILDAIACMVSVGVIDETGRILSKDEIDPQFASYIGEYAGKKACFIDPDNNIFITQADVREVQLAKAAIRGGIETLLKTLDATSADIKNLLLAGGFGMRMNPHSAAAIGLFPPELESRVKLLGNAAGRGAAEALMHPDQSKKIQDIAENCEYLELSTSALFNDLYMDAMIFEE